MTVVRKKNKKSSTADLVQALVRLIYLLEGQNEAAAVTDLRIALHDLQTYQPESQEFIAALQLLHEAFEGEHELIAYTFRREDKDKESQWTEAENLYLASTGVLNLMKRLARD